MDTSAQKRAAEPGVWRTAAWAGAWFFCVLASYYAIRPVREAFGVREGPERLRWMYTGTLAAMLLATPLYGWLVRVTPTRRLAPIVYGLFITNLALFWLAFANVPADEASWLRWTFYVWVSVYNLYIVAIFWSAAVEIFSSEQAKRLFGLIAGAGTLGGLCGSEATRVIVGRTGEPRNAALFSAGLLAAAIACSFRFRASARTMVGSAGSAAEPRRDEWRDALAGMRDVFASPYLAGLAALMILASLAGTGIYMQLADLARTQFASDADRTDFYARLNNYQNSLTLVGQMAAVGWLMKRLGLGFTLSIVPAVYAIGFAAIALEPSLFVLGAVDVAQRVASFAAGVPAREVLFTVVSRDEKYRAKAFIDTVGKRAGDAAAAHGYAALRLLGWAPTAIAWASLPVAGLIAACSVWLAKQHRTRAAGPLQQLPESPQR